MDYKQLITHKAHELGFFHVGFSKADFLDEEAPRLETWLNKNHHGEMAYMANHFDKRLDPGLLVEDAKTVISLLFNYYTDQQQSDPEAPKISKYAYGEDYHYVIKDKLNELLAFIQEEIGAIDVEMKCSKSPCHQPNGRVRITLRMDPSVSYGRTIEAAAQEYFSPWSQ